MVYTYPCIITRYTDDSEYYVVEFPDLEGCITQGDDLEDAKEMAKDVLSLMMTWYEDNKNSVPKASDIEKFPTNDDDNITILNITSFDTDEYREKYVLEYKPDEAVNILKENIRDLNNIVNDLKEFADKMGNNELSYKIEKLDIATFRIDGNLQMYYFDEKEKD